jgi:DNA end-binding protein Ku
MAPRANWKGYLRLSLVSCPIALFPATSPSERVRFNQINKETGNRIRMHRVDDGTGEEVPYEHIVKGYKAGDDQYITLTREELEGAAVESTRTIDIDTFVPADEIDELYVADPYYIVPDGEVGEQAFAVIRDAIAKKGMVALARVVLSTREHVLAIRPRSKGLFATTLRYPYEVRKPEDYFDDIPDEKIPKDMLDLASHIVETKAGHFQPQKFEDRYERALVELIRKKQAGQKIAPAKPQEPAKVISLMDALRRSVEAGKGKGPTRAASARRRAPAQHRRRPAKRGHARSRKAG